MISPDKKAFVVRMPAQDHARLKARALEEGMSMNELICSLVGPYLSGQPAARKPRPPKVATVRDDGCAHAEVTKTKTPYGVTTWACRGCPATGSYTG